MALSWRVFGLTVAVAAVSAAITYLTPYAASSTWIAGGVMVAGLVVNYFDTLILNGQEHVINTAGVNNTIANVVSSVAPIVNTTNPLPGTTPPNNGPNMALAASLKAIGDIVFVNPNYAQGVIYRYLMVWYDIYGNSLGSVMPPGTGSQL